MEKIVVLCPKVSEYFDSFLRHYVLCTDTSVYHEWDDTVKECENKCRDIWAIATEQQRFAITALCQCCFGSKPII